MYTSLIRRYHFVGPLNHSGEARTPGAARHGTHWGLLRWAAAMDESGGVFGTASGGDTGTGRGAGFEWDADSQLYYHARFPFPLRLALVPPSKTRTSSPLCLLASRPAAAAQIHILLSNFARPYSRERWRVIGSFALERAVTNWFGDSKGLGSALLPECRLLENLYIFLFSIFYRCER
jgi:hypothetical protein